MDIRADKHAHDHIPVALVIALQRRVRGILSREASARAAGARQKVRDEAAADARVLMTSDQGLPALVHGSVGMPRPIILRFDEARHRLLCAPRGKFARRFFRAREADIIDTTAICMGRCSDNFARTAKYSEPHLLHRLDSRCLSLVLSEDVLDLEFETSRHRDMVAYCLVQLVQEHGNCALKLTPGRTSRKLRHTPTRLLARHVATADAVLNHVMTERFILLCIVLNVVVMAYNSANIDQDTKRILEHAELAFNCIYTIEAMLRILSMEGLGAYLFNTRDGSWNMLDITIVTLGWFTFINRELDGPNIPGLTAFRAFRALRTMRFIDGIRTVLDTFSGTLDLVAQATYCYLYFLWLSAVFGMQLFGGSVTARRCSVCVLRTTDDRVTRFGGTAVTSATCSAACDTSSMTNCTFMAAPERFCMTDAQCQASNGEFCADRTNIEALPPSQSLYRPEGNPMQPYTGFGSFFPALNTVFLISSGAGMKFTLDAARQTTSQASVLFYVLTTVFVSYVLRALFIAIVRVSYGDQARRMKDESKLIAQAKYESSRVENARKLMLSEYVRLASISSLDAAERLVFPAAAILRAVGAGDSVGAPMPLEHASCSNAPVPRDQLATALSDANGCDGNAEGRGDDHLEDVDKVTATHSLSCCGAERTHVKMCKLIAVSPKFDRFISFAILLNTILLASEHYGMSNTHVLILDVSEVAFAFIFLFEVFIKSFALQGFSAYITHPEDGQWNRFDFLIVLASMVEVICKIAGSAGGVSFSMLRSFRLLRIVRLIRHNQKLAEVLTGVLHSLAAMLDLLMFMTVVIIVFSILGMELYGGKLQVGGVTPRSNFDTFSDSFLSMFKMMSGGGTVTIFFNVLQSDTGYWSAPIFFVLYQIFTTYITLNFLIVILCSNFTATTQQIEKAREELKCRQKIMLTRRKSQRSNLGSFDSSVSWYDSVLEQMRERICNTCCKGGRNMISEFCERRKYYSCWLVPPGDRIRIICMDVMENDWFERFIIFAIVLSSVLLCLESPYPPYDAPQLHSTLRVCDIVFMIVFIAEFAIKCVAGGFLFGDTAYLKDSWNRLDCFVLVVTFIGMMGVGDSAVGRVFRIGRVLRPLRMINRNEGMKVIINALLQSMVPIFYTCGIIMAFFLLFSILGLTLFSGKFYRCNDPAAGPYMTDCVGVFPHRELGHPVPRVWSTPGYSFDDVFLSLDTLFQVVTRKGWTPVLYSAMDVPAADGQQPEKNNAPLSAVFFMIFVFFGSFYLLKVFVGIIVAHFRKFSGTALLTDRQLQWVGTQRMMSKLSAQRQPPSQPLRRKIHNLVSHHHFTVITTSIVLMHLIFMSAESQPPPPHEDTVMQMAHWIFTSFYAIEVLLRVVALGKSHFRSPGNVFETLAVIAMLVVPLVVENGRHGVGPLRALYFSRVIFLIRASGYFGELEKLFETLSNCMIPIANITALFVLFMFVYAVFGLQMFATVKHGLYLNANQNFETFPRSMLTLFQVASGENWIKMLPELGVPQAWCSVNPHAVEALKSDCGAPEVSKLLFFTFYIFVFCVFLNLYVASILDMYSSSAKSSSCLQLAADMEITYAQMERYQNLFTKFDTKGTGRIRDIDVTPLLEMLGPPLGLMSKDDISRELAANRGANSFQHIMMLALRQQKAKRAISHCRTEMKSRLSRQTSLRRIQSAVAGHTRSRSIAFNTLLNFLVTDAAKNCGMLDKLLGFEDCVAMELHEAALVVQRNWRVKSKQRAQLARIKRKQRMLREGSFIVHQSE